MSLTNLKEIKKIISSMNWLTSLQVSKKLILLNIIAVFAVSGVGYTGYHFISDSAKRTTEMFNNRLLPVKWLNENKSLFRAMEADFLNLIMTNDASEKERYVDRILNYTQKFKDNMAEYEKIQFDSVESELVQRLNESIMTYFDRRRVVIDVATQAQNGGAYNLYTGTMLQVIDNANNILEKLAEYNIKAAYEIDRQNKATIKTTVVVFGLIMLFSFAIMVVLGWLIAKSITAPLNEAVVHLDVMAKGNFAFDISEKKLAAQDEFGKLAQGFDVMNKNIRSLIDQIENTSERMASSSEELAATSSNLSEGAQEEAASIEEASASLEEVSGSGELINVSAKDQAVLAEKTFKAMEDLKADNNKVVEFAARALSTAESSTKQANAGQTLMERTIAMMNTIDESTKKIAETVSLIGDISDQVNLLALNASIEAARAGEHGRGFAVVAEEISTLADETAASAKGISELVTKGLNEVGKGREYVDATSVAFNNIISYIDQTGELVKQISESAEKQARSSDSVLTDSRSVMEMAHRISSSTHEQMITNSEMAKTIEQINHKTQITAASAEEIAANSAQISMQAETLRNQIGFFKVK